MKKNTEKKQDITRFPNREDLQAWIAKRKKCHAINPKKSYNRKDKSWKDDME